MQALRWLGLALFATCVCALSVQKPLELGPRWSSYSRVVVFGDSLVDNGNGTYLLTNKTWPADPAFFNGRFSNGPTWVEQLASKLHVSHVDVLAYGGATTNNSVAQGYSGYNSDVRVPDVRHQVTKYLERMDGHLDPGAIYIVSGGSNDVFFGSQKTLDILGLAEKSVRTLQREAERLVEHGARLIVFPLLTDVTKTPSETQYDNFIDVAGGAVFTNHFNTRLRAAARALRHHVEVKVVDLFGIERYLFKHAKQYGLENTHDACLKGTTKPEVKAGVKRSVCAKPDTHFFWDIYHPTARAHELIADFVAPQF
ncbi:hypothetical protein MCAP1_001036 [Malassezia caprae]|uniref:Uncharacterized protein n=1 Tax=Malassezia caprae TaxID=1381934 RepID=A0AAF0E570_9BASI|nr:hypothetical protein MCAP1_001036 [Malassezia caprae]